MKSPSRRATAPRPRQPFPAPRFYSKSERERGWDYSSDVNQWLATEGRRFDLAEYRADRALTREAVEAHLTALAFTEGGRYVLDAQDGSTGRKSGIAFDRLHDIIADVARYIVSTSDPRAFLEMCSRGGRAPRSTTMHWSALDPLEGLSIPEQAERLGCSIRQVSNLRAARRKAIAAARQRQVRFDHLLSPEPGALQRSTQGPPLHGSTRNAPALESSFPGGEREHSPEPARELSNTAVDHLLTHEDEVEAHSAVDHVLTHEETKAEVAPTITSSQPFAIEDHLAKAREAAWLAMAEELANT
ncbi:hypothetical protein [Arenivirga flava]|uniref:Uncharacterized protein n=1 Tax=Arenivirga flava TaxID=1930060 RepID=A0AA37UHL4_9MICO|nr:hypothetical protein [Arenivirga flava]GMA27050.1 hypothetical protein GCM10025874_03030 [Arenivirga flava]